MFGHRTAAVLRQKSWMNAGVTTEISTMMMPSKSSIGPISSSSERELTKAGWNSPTKIGAPPNILTSPTYSGHQTPVTGNGGRTRTGPRTHSRRTVSSASMTADYSIVSANVAIYTTLQRFWWSSARPRPVTPVRSLDASCQSDTTEYSPATAGVFFLPNIPYHVVTIVWRTRWHDEQRQ